MVKLTIGKRINVMVPTIQTAVAVYERTRDESGEGASTFPDGALVVDGQSGKLRISYNGRVWKGETAIS